MGKRVLGYLAVGLVLAWVVLVLLSWLLSATMGDGVRSLLSSEGIRFFFGGFVDMMLKPLLVWLLLLSMAFGCLRGSGLLATFTTDAHIYHRRQGLRLVALLLVLYVALLLLLTATPHAVLLSATGGLWPSPFSRALVPVAAFGIIVFSVSYGAVTRHFTSLTDVWQSLSDGMATAAPLLVLYVLLMQLYSSLCFVFGS